MNSPSEDTRPEPTEAAEAPKSRPSGTGGYKAVALADAAPQGAGPTVESLAARLSSVTGLSTEAILRSVPQVLVDSTT